MKLKLFVSSIFILVGACAAWSQTKHPPETRNAALRYWMAFAEMQDPPADKATQELLEQTAAGAAAWDEKKLGPILDANGAAIRTMQRATKLPDCDWGLEYELGSRASIAYAPRARVLSRLNTLQGIREMANGNSQAAVDTWLAGIRFSKHLADGGTLIFALIAKSALLPNLQALATVAKQGQLSDSQKNQIYVPLKEMREDGFNWSDAWGLEELVGEQFFDELRDSKHPATTYETLMGEPMPSRADIPNSEDARNFRDYMRAVQSAMKLPPNATNSQLSALETRKRALPEIVQRLIPNAQKVNDARLEVFTARTELLESIAAK